MATTYISDASTASPPAYAGAGENAVVLVSREPSRSGANKQTTDTWGGPIDAIREAYNDYQYHPLVDSLSVTQNGASGRLVIVWKVDFTGGTGSEPPPEAEDEQGDEWNCSLIEVPTPLAAHPYFQVAYVEEAGSIIEDEIAAADLAIKLGRNYIASGPYKEWVKRYYGLRMAGVEEWIQYGVEITRTFTTNALADAQAAMDGLGQVVAANAINMPLDVRATLNRLQRISDYTNSGPSTAQFVQAVFEYVKRPTTFAFSAINNVGRWDMVESWWGLAQWSAVIYPGGTWDPVGEVD